MMAVKAAMSLTSRGEITTASHSRASDTQQQPLKAARTPATRVSQACRCASVPGGKRTSPSGNQCGLRYCTTGSRAAFPELTAPALPPVRAAAATTERSALPPPDAPEVLPICLACGPLQAAILKRPSTALPKQRLEVDSPRRRLILRAVRTQLESSHVRTDTRWPTSKDKNQARTTSRLTEARVLAPELSPMSAARPPTERLLWVATSRLKNKAWSPRQFTNCFKLAWAFSRAANFRCSCVKSYSTKKSLMSMESLKASGDAGRS
mmetsp:Transcript_68051/g.221565  ORF Transcript_68051/g.221565 Transcript_68051/m.221565 type:complete len:266 (+) Transcript_68051:4123-4920(+)